MQDKKITVIITSVIAFADKQLSYSSVRSSFSPEERIRQSIATIESIRKKMPEAQVIFLEMGKKRDATSGLPALVDKYIYVGNNPLVRWACDGLHKGMGEAIGLLTARKQLRTNADLYFKISGRYFLTEEFNPGSWSGKGFFFRKYGDDCFSTRLYGFDASHFDYWQKTIRRSLYRLYKGSSIENALAAYIDPGLVNDVRQLGVAGFVAPGAVYLAE